MSSRTAPTPTRHGPSTVTARLHRAAARHWPKAFFVLVQLIFAMTLIVGIQLAERIALGLDRQQLIGAAATVAVVLVAARYTRYIIRGLTGRNSITVEASPALGAARLAGTSTTASHYSVALHEAAHAVVAHEFGLEVVAMTMDADGNGRTSYTDELTADEPAEAVAFFRRNAMIALAGWVQDRVPSHGSAGDWTHYTEYAYRLVSLGGAASFNDFFDQAVPEVRAILTERAVRLEALADALQQNGKLDRDEITAILAG